MSDAKETSSYVPGETRRRTRKRRTRLIKQQKSRERRLLSLVGILLLLVLLGVLYRQSFCYQMMIDGQVVAQVGDKKEAVSLWDEMLKSRSEKLGQEVIAQELEFEKVSKKGAVLLSGNDLKKAIEDQVTYQTEAYTVKVDGVPLFSLLDGTRLEAMLEEYKKRYKPELTEDIKLLSVEFKENVEVVPELVDVEALSTEFEAWEILDTLKVPDTTYEIQKGDNFWDIAIKFDTTVTELLQYNPEAQPEKLMPGDQILIKPGQPQLSVLATLETTVVEPIPAPTRYIDDASLLISDRQIVDEGVPGEKEVTYRIILENGNESVTEVLQETVLKEPEERVIKRGTKTVSARGVGGRNYGVVSASRVTSDYGYRIHPIYKTRRFHEGIDLAAPVGRSVHAYSSGTVTFVGKTGALGLAVYINHGNGLETRYGHLSKAYVEKGEKVSTGDKIGAVGSTGLSTGPHLHFEVRKNGKTQNPWNYI